MNIVIKSGLYIEGAEVTSEHLGKKIQVIQSDNERWLPVGFTTTIKGVYSNGVIDLEDTGGEDSCYTVAPMVECWEFKWVTPAKPKKSSKEQRQKLAKSIREAKMVLDTAIKEAEEIGMVVDISNDFVKITFNPPAETY